jgi:geranylgeranyl pyrophosphate synthase
VHDDIEDGDELRYGRRTLHAAHGIPMALNVGDLLIGEGYRLISRAAADGLDSSAVACALAIAADGHRTLCLGQGEDIAWARHPGRLAVGDVLQIIRRKTAPPFEVAMKLGSLAAGTTDASLEQILHDYSQAVGIAYQIRDDLHDLHDEAIPGDLTARRPSVLLALASDAGSDDPAVREALGLAWQGGSLSARAVDELREAMETLDVESRARALLDDCKQQALAAIARLDAPALKALLRRLLGKIFYDVETMTCCIDRSDRPS